MKTMDQFRSTDTFMITGGAVEDMSKIWAHCVANGVRLVGVAHDKKAPIGTYCVRWLMETVAATEHAEGETALIEARVEVYSDVVVRTTRIVASC